MKREPLQTEAYFIDCISETKESIRKREGYIEKKAEVQMNWVAIYYGLYSNYADLLKYRYSLGDDIAALKTLIDQSVKWAIEYYRLPEYRTQKYADYFGIYDDTLSTFSLGYLLGSDKSLLLEYTEAVDICGKDALIDRMIQFTDDQRKLSEKLVYPKAFETLYPVFDAPASQRSSIIKQHLSTWYAKVARKASWYNTHKPGNGVAFFGYWSFEAAAITFLLNIDDTDYRDMKYYPKDLVDYARNKK
jgi:Domain of unknown function (DUF1911)/Domain of unknown function (DUF1910)